MNKRLFGIGILILFISCVSRQPAVLTQEGGIDTTQTNEPQKEMNNVVITPKDTITMLPELVENVGADSILSFKVYHEKPYISADSLAIILTLWDSIISNPLLGYSESWIKTENGWEKWVYISDECELVLLTPFDNRAKTASALYWNGSPELPANRGLVNKSETLYIWVNNIPTLTITYNDFIDATYDFKELVGIKRKGKSYVKSRVRFVVEADGSVSNAHIIASSTPEMDRLALIISSYILKYTKPTHRDIPCRVVMDLWI